MIDVIGVIDVGELVVVAVVLDVVGDGLEVVVLAQLRLDAGGCCDVGVVVLDVVGACVEVAGPDVEPAEDAMVAGAVLGPASHPASIIAPTTPRNARRPMAPPVVRSSGEVTKPSVLPTRRSPRPGDRRWRDPGR